MVHSAPYYVAVTSRPSVSHHVCMSTPENYSVLTPNPQSLAMHRKAIKDLSVLSPRVNLHTKAWCRLQRLIMMA